MIASVVPRRTFAQNAERDDDTPFHSPNLGFYRRWLADQRGPSPSGITRRCGDGRSPTSTAFWQSIWDYFDLQSPTARTAAVLAQRNDAWARSWFPGGRRSITRGPGHAACRGRGLPRGRPCDRQVAAKTGVLTETRLARIAPARGSPRSARPSSEGTRASAPAIGSPPTFRTSPRPSSPSLATARASVRFWSVCAPRHGRSPR